jgi:NitT/TauT family transport system ATP-binding protein
MDANGRIRENAQYLVLSSAAARPDERQGLWLYAQMVRWNQAEFSSLHMDAVSACMSPELFDAALYTMARKTVLDDGIGAFSGPAFDPTDIPAYLAAFDPK